MAAPTVPLTPSPVDILSSLESSSSSTIATPALATADDSKAKSQGQGQKAPGISIHIPFEQAPLDLHNGLKEVAAHAIRGNVRFCQKAGHRWMGAAGANDERGKGDRGEWWWNVAFSNDPSLAPGALKVTTSLSSFIPPTHPPADAASVSHPFIVTIHYSRPSEAFRGLGHVLGVTRNLLRPASSSPSLAHPFLADLTGQWVLDPNVGVLLEREEKANFETLGTMIDCSRNGVLGVSSVKFLCRSLALMGYNMLQLYTEDTYKIEDEPFFGYLRGGYSEAELREIDSYAYDLGIEVIPCIQTLGHLGQMLQWPRFLGLRDTTEVLLAEWPETYAMLEKMIATATKPFRSKNIHLGMDETHGLGHGRYHSIFGHANYKDPTRIFVEHLQRVNDICLRMGLKPMIWSDMLFCLNARNNSLLGYYDSAKPSSVSVEGIPANMELVYWDYYHTSEASYASRIENHWDLGRKSPWMAAGSWTWSRFWTALPFTFATCRASQNASKSLNSGVKHVFLTIWGDEANEVDLYSSLPAWAYYAEHGYTRDEEVDVPLLRAKFDGIVGAHFDDFVVASRLDDMNPEQQSVDDRIHFAPNLSKWLLWEEPFFGFVSPSVHASGLDLESHFSQLSTYLSSRLSVLPSADPSDASKPARSITDHPFNARLRFPYLLAETLKLKAGLRLRLHNAYRQEDWKTLRELAGREPESRMSRLRMALEKLWKYHRQLWMSMYKPFGWETVELRYGGLRARLDTMHARLIRFLDHLSSGGIPGQHLVSSSSSNPASTLTPTAGAGAGGDVLLLPTGAESSEYEETVTSLPELEEELQVVYGSAEQLLDYHRVSRPTYC